MRAWKGAMGGGIEGEDGTRRKGERGRRRKRKWSKNLDKKCHVVDSKIEMGAKKKIEGDREINRVKR